MSDFQVGKSTPKKSNPSYIYSIISVALVLFMLGLLGMVVLHAQKLSEYFKENIEISIILKDNAKEADVYQFMKQLEGEKYIKSTQYVSKEAAAEQLKKEFDEEFIELLGYNPLYASINIYLYADFAQPDSLSWIESNIMNNDMVQEIYYQRSLLQIINDNVKKIGFVIIIISGLLFLIAITLIDNTIRLAMYSNRFLIKSMQLVGAMRWFIIKPFIGKGILNGFISGIIALIGLTALLYYGQKQIPELLALLDIKKFVVLFCGIVLIGIFISWISTHRAVRKYLRMKLDELY